MSITHEDIALVISESIQDNQFDGALEQLKGLRPVDIADAIEHVEPSIVWRLLERLPKRAEIFSYLEPEQQVILSRHFGQADRRNAC